MTGRRSHGRLSALNGVVHQGSWCPVAECFAGPGVEFAGNRIKLGLV